MVIVRLRDIDFRLEGRADLEIHRTEVVFEVGEIATLKSHHRCKYPAVIAVASVGRVVFVILKVEHMDVDLVLDAVGIFVLEIDAIFLAEVPLLRFGITIEFVAFIPFVNQLAKRGLHVISVFGEGLDGISAGIGGIGVVIVAFESPLSSIAERIPGVLVDDVPFGVDVNRGIRVF